MINVDSETPPSRQIYVMRVCVYVQTYTRVRVWAIPPQESLVKLYNGYDYTFVI